MSGTYTARQPLTLRALGQMLRDLRIAAGEKLRIVAAAADMDPSLLGKIERGQRLPTPGQCIALARHFSVPATQLEGARMADEVLKTLAANPAAAALALPRIEEGACEYRVSKPPTAVHKPAAAGAQAGKEGLDDAFVSRTNPLSERKSRSLLRKKFMPTLQFKGKPLVKTTLLCPSASLNVKSRGLSKTPSLHDNLIIEGDNLKALKSAAAPLPGQGQVHLHRPALQHRQRGLDLQRQRHAPHVPGMDRPGRGRARTLPP